MDKNGFLKHRTTAGLLRIVPKKEVDVASVLVLFK